MGAASLYRNLHELCFAMKQLRVSYGSLLSSCLCSTPEAACGKFTLLADATK